MNSSYNDISLNVYVPDENIVWQCAEIVGISTNISGQFKIKISKNNSSNDFIDVYQIKSYGSSILNVNQFPLRNDTFPTEGFDDMASLNCLHEASILQNLELRFKHFHPYTFAGDICIAINPFKWLNLYASSMKTEYNISKPHLKPHVYMISSKAYRALSRQTRSQSILVTGESGAGKTETVKILLGHLAYSNGRSTKLSNEIADKIFESNQLLESFGNAKTEKNENSSRFGKFIKLYFDNTNLTLVGNLILMRRTFGKL